MFTFYFETLNSNIVCLFVIDVGNCSSCDECSVQIKESTPLLAQNVRSTVNCCVLFLLLLTFAAGTTIGIYLLVEGKVVLVLSMFSVIGNDVIVLKLKCLQC